MGLPYFKKASLRFECQRCGDCCSTWRGNVYIRGEDVPGLASALDLLPGEFLRKYTRKGYTGHRHLVLKQNGDCIFYEEGRCIVNEVKPASCYAWPFWKGVCTVKRGWDRASKRCPGIGRGKVWQTRQIESMLAWSP